MTTMVEVDGEGRLAIPEALRKELGIKAGDLFVVEADEARSALHFTKAENPFDILAAHAIAEYRAGRTVSLRDFAAERGISLEDE